MPETFDPIPVLNFLLVDPIQWWYYAVAFGVVAAAWVVKSNIKKEVSVDAAAQSPLQSAEEYGEGESELGHMRENEDSERRHRDAVLDTIIHRPRNPIPQIQGDGSAIDQATEYMIASAMINSAKYVRFKNIKIPTKFGELVFDNEELPKTVEQPKQETSTRSVPEIPEEDNVEEAA